MKFGFLPHKVELLFSKDRNAWRLYICGWVAPIARQRLGENGEVFPVQKPNLDDLRDFMLQCDASYSVHAPGNEAIEVAAKGRSAEHLWQWLSKHLGEG
jgi:hypothetical protein